jgi:hypothetical protein
MVMVRDVTTLHPCVPPSFTFSFSGSRCGFATYSIFGSV